MGYKYKVVYMKKEIDYLMDEVLKVTSIYDKYGIRYSVERNFICSFHQDDVPSAKLFGNHVFCFAERRNYYASDILKFFSKEDYVKVCKAILKKYPGKISKRKKKETKIDISDLHPFKKGEKSFDIVLDFIKGYREDV